MVPKNTIAMVNVCGIGQDPSFWIKDYNEETKGNKYKNINMKEINLDFWFDDDGRFSKKKNSASFVAFHLGKRDCIGQSLAMKQLMIVLSMIFMEYKVEHKSGKTDFQIGSVFRGTVNEPISSE